MPLNGFSSECRERQPLIVSRDKGHKQEHRANNKNLNHVTHYKIDGVVIKVGNKCDFLLMNEDTCTAYLIELKGSDLNKAVKQLEDTESALKDELKGYDLEFRIVASKARVHAINSVTFKRFQKKKKSAFKWHRDTFEEDI